MLLWKIDQFKRIAPQGDGFIMSVAMSRIACRSCGPSTRRCRLKADTLARSHRRINKMFTAVSCVLSSRSPLADIWTWVVCLQYKDTKWGWLAWQSDQAEGESIHPVMSKEPGCSKMSLLMLRSAKRLSLDKISPVEGEMSMKAPKSQRLVT